MKRLIKTFNTLLISICFTFSFTLYANADPINWSQLDNRCPVSSDRFNREVGIVTGLGGTYYWCYWYDSGVHYISMRPTNILGGFERSLVTKGETPHYYKKYLIICARQYVDYLGFCGEV